MHIRKRKRIAAVIPTASMADIAFLLITFFMVTTKFQVDKQHVTLPATRLRTDILAESAFISVGPPGASVALGINGSLVRFSTGTELSTPVVDQDDLQQRIAAVIAEKPGQFFVIKGDEKVSYETFDVIVGALKDAGARNVTFLSRQKV